MKADPRRLNRERLIREELKSRGIWPARKSGTQLFYHCPLPGFEDYTPRFVVSTEWNRWHCEGCGRGGSVIDLVMRLDSVKLSVAVLRLKRSVQGQARGGEGDGQ